MSGGPRLVLLPRSKAGYLKSVGTRKNCHERSTKNKGSGGVLHGCVLSGALRFLRLQSVRMPRPRDFPSPERTTVLHSTTVSHSYILLSLGYVVAYCKGI